MKLPKAYEPGKYESDIYALWEQGGAFEPKNRGSTDRFSLVAPPPNANADLHMGHALTLAIEDTLVRYHRMQGKAALFVPGADHAGFESQVVYEKRLEQEGKSRFDFSREELYRRVWDFVQANKDNYQSQMRALGASFDWSKFTFTLDSKVVERAYKTFKKMWEDDLIYRGERVVNFCTFHGTSFSDIEVVHEEEKTHLWHIAYPVSGGGGEVIVATTRPETMLGDTAVTVHPDDSRYKKLVGKTVNLPLGDRQIPIIADEFVDPKFGSGAVKLTPAHDPDDFEVAQRHKLPVIEVITTEGKTGKQVPLAFRGLSVTEARQAVVKALEDEGLIRKTEDYVHSVGKCYKCGTTIEPLLREQWFVKMRPLADPALEALRDNKITFYPPSKLAQTISYLKEVRDWNISRQIAWGIPIPAFQNIDDPADWIFDKRVDEEFIEVDGKTYRRDPDVFDTWFSSGQWPYVTLDHPSELAEKFYPLNLMETGGEILYQWVARMIMLGLYTTSEVPFQNVYIHGYVLAEDGAKMSKSLGNVINPQAAIEQFGSDALRMGLLAGRRPGVNQGYHPAKIKGGRNFANKFWNVARFIEGVVGENHSIPTNVELKTAADHWIAERSNQTIQEMSQALENYRLSEAYEALYQFVWRDLADWYIEASKERPNAPLLAHLLEATLKIAHPFAPFVTETIWQALEWEADTLLAVQKWPKLLKTNADKVGDFEQVVGIVSETRHITNALGATDPTLYFQNSPLLEEQGRLIARLARLAAVSPSPEQSDGLKLTNTTENAWLDIDKAKAASYVDTLKTRRTEITEVIKRLEDRLANKNYRQKAPKQLIDETEEQLTEQKELLSSIEAEVNSFAKLTD